MDRDAYSTDQLRRVKHPWFELGVWITGNLCLDDPHWWSKTSSGVYNQGMHGVPCLGYYTWISGSTTRRGLGEESESGVVRR